MHLIRVHSMFLLCVFCTAFSSLSSQGLAQQDSVRVAAKPPAPRIESQEQKKPDSLSAAESARKSAVERCLAIYYTRPIDADTLRPWSLMHGLIGYGKGSTVTDDGELVNAVEYLCNNGRGDDRRLMYLHNNRLALSVGPGFQGHTGQFLAMLAQSVVPSDFPIKVDKKEFTVMDLVRYEMSDCDANSELTFKLIGIANYLDTETAWQSRSGETWSVERLLKEELNKPINGAACGGIHRMMGIAYAVRKREFEKKPIEGTWKTAAEKTAEYQRLAFSMQNKNGSFSSNWFASSGDSLSANRRVYTTGHTLEWLAFSLDKETLKHPRVGKAVDHLVQLMLTAPGYDLDVGPRGHAIRALRLYEAKVFGSSNFQQLVTSRPIQKVTEPTTPDRYTIENTTIATSPPQTPAARPNPPQQRGRIFRRRNE